MKKLRYFIEAILLWLLLSVFRMLSPDVASNLGGLIGRHIGPRLGASKKAFKNLSKSFSEKSKVECDLIVRGMWENLGRVMAEYPHLKSIIMNNIDIVGIENLEKIGEHKKCVVIGAHFGNWELLPFLFNHRIQWPVFGVYRRPNNPYTEKLLEQCRHMDLKPESYIPKSSKGAREMIKVLQDGKRLGLLIDQKYNKGIAVPFFGRDAMTTDSFATLAFKYNCEILPVKTERTKGCHFKITILPPLEQFGDNIFETTKGANMMLEDWITKKPEQWLWLHRRWDSKALKHT